MRRRSLLARSGAAVAEYRGGARRPSARGFTLAPFHYMIDNRPNDADEKSPEERHRTTVDPDTESVSQKLVETVAVLEGVDTDELAVLTEFVDSDALDALFRSRADGTPRKFDGRVRFEYVGYDVSVRGDGTISLVRLDSAPDC